MHSPSAGAFRLSDPFSFENLDIYFLRRPDLVPSGSYDVLHYAMERKTMIVHETGNVRELLLENTGDTDVFIQAGDIVKGGRQDRVMGADLIVGKKSAPTPIPTFCVEQRRWRQRGDESPRHFGSYNTQASCKRVKLSNMRRRQDKVWDSVDAQQKKLAGAVGATVQNSESSSSYQLSLEHEKVQERIRSGMSAILPVVALIPDSVGIAFAINGQMNCSDAYASHDLFALLWEKMLRAALTEAVAESLNADTANKPGDARKPIALADVESFLNLTAMETVEPQIVANRIRVRQYRHATRIRYETEDLL